MTVSSRRTNQFRIEDVDSINLKRVYGKVIITTHSNGEPFVIISANKLSEVLEDLIIEK